MTLKRVIFPWLVGFVIVWLAAQAQAQELVDLCEGEPYAEWYDALDTGVLVSFGYVGRGDAMRFWGLYAHSGRYALFIGREWHERASQAELSENAAIWHGECMIYIGPILDSSPASLK